VKAGLHPPKREFRVTELWSASSTSKNNAYPRTTVFETSDTNEMIGIGSILWKERLRILKWWESIRKNDRVLCAWVATTLLHGMADYCFHQTMDRRVIGQLASKSATLPDDETMTNTEYRSDWRKSYGIWEQGLPINETDPPTHPFPVIRLRI